MRLRAVFFDLDGTLLDSVPAILSSFHAVFDEMDIPFDETGIRKMIGIPLRVQAPLFAGDRALEFVERYRVIYGRQQDEEMRLFPGSIEALEAIRSAGYLTALVTSKSARITRVVLERTEMDRFFDTVVTADDVIHPKPHPEPIVKALEALRVKPDEAVYVGDATFDIEASRSAGVRMVGVSWGARSSEDLLADGAERVFDTWDELTGWLREDG